MPFIGFFHACECSRNIPDFKTYGFFVRLTVVQCFLWLLGTRTDIFTLTSCRQTRFKAPSAGKSCLLWSGVCLCCGSAEPRFRGLLMKYAGTSCVSSELHAVLPFLCTSGNLQ